MAEIAVALVNLDLAVASLTGLLQVGVLVEASIASFAGHLVQTSSQLFSSFQTSSSALDGTLHRLHVGGGGETGGAIGSADNGGDDGLHDFEEGFSGVQKMISGSADGADHHVEVAGSFTGEVGAVTGGESHFLGLAVGVGDQSSSSSLHDGDGAGSGTGRHAQGGIGFAKAVEAAVLKHRSVTGEQRVADITENDFTVAQASSHLAVGVHTTVRGGQAGVLAADAGDAVRHDAAGVRGDGVHSVQALVAISNEGLQGSQFAATNEGAAGIGRDSSPGECVEHGVVEYVVWGDAFRITNDTTPASQVVFLKEDVRTHKLTKAKSVRPRLQPMSDSSP